MFVSSSSQTVRSRPCTPIHPFAGWIVSLLLAMFLLCSTSPVRAAGSSLASKSDSVLWGIAASGKKSGSVSVLVRLTSKSLSAKQRHQIVHLGGSVYRSLPLIQTVAVRIPTRNLSRLASLGFVSHLSSDVQVQKTDIFTVQGSAADFARLDYGVTGNGVGVAVLDSGVRTERDLQTADGSTTPYGSNNRLIYSQSYISGTWNYDDQCGHGTHIAGIIAGNGAQSTGSNFTTTYMGIAPKSNIINLKVLDANGSGSTSDVIAAIQAVVANKSTYNIRVINISFGHPVYESYKTDPLCLAVESAWKAGIVVVCAAGNDGRANQSVNSSLDNEGYGTAYGSIESPGNDPYVITVGALKLGGPSRIDRIATYSSRGPSAGDFVLKPDLVAPGNKITSLNSYGSTLDVYDRSSGNALPISNYLNTGGSWGGWSSDYLILSGTSMAAPVVSGVAALLLEKYPNLSPDTVKARLMLTADKWFFPDGSTDPCTFGAGYINAETALGSSATAKGYALSPTLKKSGSATVINSISGWSVTGATCGLQNVYGGSAVSSSAQFVNPALGSNSNVWGTQVMWIGNGGGGKLSSIPAVLDSSTIYGE